MRMLIYRQSCVIIRRGNVGTEVYNGRFWSFLTRAKTFRDLSSVVLRRPFCCSLRVHACMTRTFVSTWYHSTVQSMFLPNDVSQSDPALSSWSPRIPRTLRSHSSVCIEVLGFSAVQFGSADIVDESQRGRMGVSVLTWRCRQQVVPMYRCTDAPECTMTHSEGSDLANHLLFNPRRHPHPHFSSTPATCLQRCLNQLLSRRHYVVILFTGTK